MAPAETTHMPFRAAFAPACPTSSRDNSNPHSRTFSIASRVRRKRQRLPSNGVIESAFNMTLN